MDELNPTSKIQKRPPHPKTGAKTAPGLKEKDEGFVSVDKVTLSSQKGANAAPSDPYSPTEIRHDLVNKFRSFLGSGTYVVKADEIADKIVQKIRENKNHHLI